MRTELELRLVACLRPYGLTYSPPQQTPLPRCGTGYGFLKESQAFTFLLNPPLGKGDLVEEQALFDRWLQSVVVGIRTDPSVTL